MSRWIDFVPKGAVLDAFRKDYNDNMINGYIYGEAKPFDFLMERMAELRERFRRVKVN